MTGRTTAGEDRVRRDVVSFVRRSSRMRPQQWRAWQDHHDRYVVAVPRGDTSTSVDPAASLDLGSVFGREAPLIVEIGPGTGESLVPLAKRRPEANLLAFEVYQPAIARLMTQVAREGLDNVRIVQADAVAGLTHLVPVASMHQLWLFFPDPWHKARHHKRRLVTTAFADLVAARMQPGGHWRLATDWPDYAHQMRAVLDGHPAFGNQHLDGWAPRWPERPVTRFERRGLDAARQVFDLTYRRLPPPP